MKIKNVNQTEPVNKTETVVQNKVEKQVVPYILREIVNKTETEVQPQVKHETKTTNQTIVQPHPQLWSNHKSKEKLKQ